MTDAAATSDVSPPEALQVAAHPLRWQLLRELAKSDRTVHELTGALGEAQNLVSYHLGKLRSARLVSARRSSADGRDAYYAADLTRIGELLAAAAAAIHPGLVGRSPSSDGAEGARPQVLFLCTGNSARSQMAEALLRHRSDGAVDAFSAGSRPKPLHPNAVRVMRDEHGIDLSAHQPKHLDVFADDHLDWVITLCDKVREVCPEFRDEPETIHWSIADPAATGGDDDTTYAAFQHLADELESRVGFLLAVISDRTPPPSEQETS